MIAGSVTWPWQHLAIGAIFHQVHVLSHSPALSFPSGVHQMSFLCVLQPRPACWPRIWQYGALSNPYLGVILFGTRHTYSVYTYSRVPCCGCRYTVMCMSNLHPPPGGGPELLSEALTSAWAAAPHCEPNCQSPSRVFTRHSASSRAWLDGCINPSNGYIEMPAQCQAS